MDDPDPNCSTCGGLGEVDETLGAAWEAHADAHAPCPDCVAPRPIQRYKLPKPRVCLCHWLGFLGFKCRAHGAM